MVNTRRMESSGSVPFSGRRYRTRRTIEGTAELGFLSELATESEESQAEEDSWSSQGKRKKHGHTKTEKPLTSQRVRELRSRFACNELKFTPHHVRKREVRSCRKRVTLNERHSLTVYSSHKMHDDLDSYNPNDTDDDCYSPRRRHLRHLKAYHLGRVERRTALSLRPLTAKSYVTCKSDDSDTVGVRRSTRQKSFQYKTLSWITDDQMPKKGYPNVEYSEEDSSRDAPDLHGATNAHRTLETRRAARHDMNGMTTRREIKKNTKYLHDYETSEMNAGRRLRQREQVRSKSGRSLRNRGSNNKENKSTNGNINSRTNGRMSRVKVENRAEDEDEVDEEEEEVDEEEEDQEREEEGEEEEEEDEGDDKEVDREGDDLKKNGDVGQKPAVKKNGVQKGDGSVKENGETNGQNKEPSSESDEIRKVKTRSRRNRILNDKFSPRRTRTSTRKMSASSSSSEEEKGYSLRDRPPKPATVTLRDKTTLRTRDINTTLRSSRHFNIRRNVSSSSCSDSSDSDDRRRKGNKYSNAKSPHSKSDQPLKSGAGGSKLIPIGPETLDSKVRFSSVGGLDSHVQCLKEMILLPMMYPEVFKKFQIQPPRGVLFHGSPGTGKTLIARALANECSFGSRKVTFFMRKGADLLSKWIGESEKQLRALFEQAADMKPSIIFFDELDGLAPVRSSRQDQIHASIVSTLLALMDGLDNRGEVIVIGATNRIDAIDPALRRPGRFDRELYFPLPARKEREEILNVHVSLWATPPSKHLLNYLAENAVGYCGSDLRALCSEAVIQSFRRTYPQVYGAEHRLLLDPEMVRVEKIDFLRAKSLLVASAHRVGQSLGRKMLPILKPILEESFVNILSVLEKTFPHGCNPSLAKVKLSAGVRPAQLLIVGNGPEHGQTTHLAPAILHSMEHIHPHILDLITLHRESARSPEETCVQVFHEVRRNVPSVLYIPSIDRWWNLVNETVRAIFIAQLMHLDPNSPILLLASSDTVYNDLPVEIKEIFSRYRKEVYQINTPTAENRKAFFKSLLVDTCLKPPRPPRTRPKTPPPLPRARTPPPTPMSEQQKKILFEQEERTLRELRIFLRDMCKKLANNRLFYLFTKPVDTDEVPDYPNIIKQPMDLETMMTKVDFHRYECAKDFLKDIELICQNALEYNPARTSADKQIRHRACSLRDYAFTLIKNEMDSDFEDKCQEIARRRLERKASVTQYLPAFLQTPSSAQTDGQVGAQNANGDPVVVAKETNQVSPVAKESSHVSSNGTSSGTRVSPCRKRRIPSWQRGMLGSKKKKRKSLVGTTDDVIDEKSSGDESKENNPEVLKMDDAMTSEESNGNPPADQKLVESTTPLTVNCDTTTNLRREPDILQSPNTRRRLSDLLSPSELLEDSLDFDDVDQALNENVSLSLKQIVDINEEDLHKTLEYAVKVTYNQPLQSLLDLHFQLSRIVSQYSRTSNRRCLSNELRKELTRFKKEIGDIADMSAT